jgi:2-methylaconitate cis-trans-isomerase PrpF
MNHSPQIKIPATYMRGGTSKGVFFSLKDLPEAAQQAGEARDALLLRMIGSPDPYGKHTDGMGGATSSTSKTVIVSKSMQAGHDVDYLFGQVSIDKPFIDWSGNCGNLTAAVGAFAINKGLVDKAKIPQDGIAEGALFPTGNLVDELDVPDVGTLKTTMINAGIPTIFINADSIGYSGTELQDDINNDAKALAMFETIRAHGAVKMGLINEINEAVQRQHTPKIAFVANATAYVSSSGKQISVDAIDLNVRALSMGKLHHAMMGTAAVAIGTAAAIPGTLVNLAAGSEERNSVCFGHPSGTLKVGAEASLLEEEWKVNKVIMSRSARRLMDGYVYVLADVF